MHMPRDGVLQRGTQVESSVELDPVIYDGFLDLGFTRNFASSQAYADRYGNNSKVIPTKANQGLSFKKLKSNVYEWLGFEAYQLIFDLLSEAERDKQISLDVFAYDLNEPDIVAALKAIRSRLRIVIDDSGEHRPSTSAESKAARLLAASAGAANVKRMKFIKLQHNKVLIVKRNGVPFKVLFGSTNFSFRGLYIQANNALVLYDTDAAAYFEKVFSLAFTNAGKPAKQWFESDPISKQWYAIAAKGKPKLSLCYSPHANASLSMKPVGDAIKNASSCVFFSIAFLYQTKSGPVRSAINALMKSKVFSYGISDKKGGLEVYKPDGSIGLVDFSYLAATAPQPFSREWSGGAGIHEHDKFVVVDFNRSGATVFTGSSNLAPSGEENNGDNLVMIQDQRVATSYAIEALRVFDHLHFRVRMQSAFGNKNAKKGGSKINAKARASRATAALTLLKPTAISGKPAWFEEYYQSGSQKEADRLLFSH